MVLSCLALSKEIGNSTEDKKLLIILNRWIVFYTNFTFIAVIGQALKLLLQVVSVELLLLGFEFQGDIFIGTCKNLLLTVWINTFIFFIVVGITLKQNCDSKEYKPPP